MATKKQPVSPPALRPLLVGAVFAFFGIIAVFQPDAFRLGALILLPLAGYTLGHAVRVPAIVKKLLVGS